jgi:hypothetical protein
MRLAYKEINLSLSSSSSNNFVDELSKKNEWVQGRGHQKINEFVFQHLPHNNNQSTWSTLIEETNSLIWSFIAEFSCIESFLSVWPNKREDNF